MEEPIKEYITITAEILLVSILLALIAILGLASRNALRVVELENNSKAIMQEYRELNMYDNKIILGSDIPEVITKYIRYYSFEIQLNDTVYKISYDKEKSYGEQIWTADYIINEILKDDIYSRFKSIINKDKYGFISGMTFIKE